MTDKQSRGQLNKEIEQFRKDLKELDKEIEMRTRNQDHCDKLILGEKIMVNKLNEEQLESLEQFHKAAERFDKDKERLTKGKPRREELEYYITMIIEYAKEGRIVCLPPLKERKIEGFKVQFKA